MERWCDAWLVVFYADQNIRKWNWWGLLSSLSINARWSLSVSSRKKRVNCKLGELQLDHNSHDNTLRGPWEKNAIWHHKVTLCSIREVNIEHHAFNSGVNESQSLQHDRWHFVFFLSYAAVFPMNEVAGCRINCAFVCLMKQERLCVHVVYWNHLQEGGKRRECQHWPDVRHPVIYRHRSDVHFSHCFLSHTHFLKPKFRPCSSHFGKMNSEMQQ